ncbi:hypothetical protein MJ923_16745, partial [Shewanella sp. 3B26]
HALHENSFIDKIVLSTSSTCEYPHRLLDKFLKNVTGFHLVRAAYSTPSRFDVKCFFSSFGRLPNFCLGRCSHCLTVVISSERGGIIGRLTASTSSFTALLF